LGSVAALSSTGFERDGSINCIAASTPSATGY
jgi:hypothetical protein